MKKLILTIVFFASIIFSGYAYDFSVYGNVSDENGNPLVQQEVTLRVYNGVDSVDFDYLSVYTDGTGNYFGTVNVNEENSVIVAETYVYACDLIYVEYADVNESGQAEINFTVCADTGNGGEDEECFVFFDAQQNFSNPLAVDFYPYVPDTSFYNFAWDFGDGETSTEDAPEHIYPDFGDYEVTVTAYSDACGEVSYTGIVSLFDYNDSTQISDCFADYFYIPDSIDFNTFNFFDASYTWGEITSWHWDFGDGTTSDEQNPVHTFAQSGEYPVSLTIETTEGCSSEVTYPVWAGDDVWYPEECQALFFTDYSSEDFLTAQFIDLSWGGDSNVMAWSWDFGDGETSNEQNPVHTFAQEGEYLVSLTIYTQSCSNTFQEIVYMEDWGGSCNDGCQAFFWPDFDSTATAVKFFDLSMPIPESWSWDFGDGETSNEQNPYHVYAAPGIYTVSLSVESDSCSSAFAMEIELFDGENNGNKSSKSSYSGVIRKAYALHKGIASDVEDLSVNTSEFTVYPNPVNDILNINFGQNIENAQIVITSINGQTIAQFNVSNKSKFEMSSSNLPSGIYFARITADGKVSVLKFVK
ncbi:MAG: PKD domain-containing protein [Chlorobi bacterium]|nr:PKD domain-containing protein [Chlorobiota bacterium]